MTTYSMTTWKNRIAVLWKTVTWFILTLIVGLSPILISWGLSYIVQSDITFKKIIMDGALLFFSATIVSSVLIDAYQSQKVPDIKSWGAGILFFGVPIIIIGLCIFFFALVYERHDDKIIGFDIFIGVQLFLLLASFVYTVLIKFGIFQTHQKMLKKLSLLQNQKLANLRNIFSSNRGHHTK